MPQACGSVIPDGRQPQLLAEPSMPRACLLADTAVDFQGRSMTAALMPIFVHANASDVASWGFKEAEECAAGTIPCYDKQSGQAW